MTVAFSCTFARAVWLETQLHRESSWENIMGRKVEKSYMESCLDSQVMILESLSLGRMILEISFKERELERMISTKSTPSNDENIKAISPKYPSKLKHEAIIKLQEGFFWVHLMMGYIRGNSRLLFPNPSPPDSRFELEISNLEFQAHNQLSHPLEGKKKLQEVYKSFRTGRKLADYPVLLGHCWKLLDFAELKWSSISFFNNEKHETAISRWSRAKTRAAKVGKGLSKNDKALELALSHWLEAIDPQHRYGHNLHLYYDEWLRSNSKEPFFYWLDFGEGKELNLNETCPRSKLQQQRIKYLSPMERIAYEVVLNDGKFLCKQTGELLHTTGDAKWIFVLSITKTLYVGEKKKGTFQHSSFLAGGATIAAGMLVVKNGILKAVWPHSSHYRPKKENFKNFISFLRENNVDLTDVKITSSLGNQRYSSSEKELAQALNILGTEVINLKDLVQEETDSVEEAAVGLEHPKTKRFHNLSGNLTNLEIPKRDEMIGRLRLQNDGLAFGPICNDNSVDYLVEDVYRTSEEAFAPKQQIIDESCKKIEHIVQEAILQKANSKKKSKFLSIGRTVVLQMENWSRTANWLCKGLSFSASVLGLGASELVSQKY